jgi:phage shock protein A
MSVEFLNLKKKLDQLQTVANNEDITNLKLKQTLNTLNAQIAQLNQEKANLEHQAASSGNVEPYKQLIRKIDDSVYRLKVKANGILEILDPSTQPLPPNNPNPINF